MKTLYTSGNLCFFVILRGIEVEYLHDKFLPFQIKTNSNSTRKFREDLTKNAGRSIF